MNLFTKIKESATPPMIEFNTEEEKISGSYMLTINLKDENNNLNVYTLQVEVLESENGKSDEQAANSLPYFD